MIAHPSLIAAKPKPILVSNSVEQEMEQLIQIYYFPAAQHFDLTKDDSEMENKDETQSIKFKTTTNQKHSRTDESHAPHENNGR